MNKIYVFIIVLLQAFLISCEKDDKDLSLGADIIDFDIAGYDVNSNINSDNQIIMVQFSSNVTSANNLIAEFQLSENASAAINGVTQVSGQTSNNFEIPLTYVVTSGDGKTVKDWYVYATNNNYSVLWGLGQFEKNSVSNNRAYSWYLDQGNTGEYSSVNCGPTSTTMAAKWSDASFSKTPEDARAAYSPDGGWWYTNDIDNYLNDNQIPHSTLSLGTEESGTKQVIKNELDAGNILILCLDMYYIRYESYEDYRVDKFYNTSDTGWGHFIVVKGYKQVDGEFYFECYDPNSYGAKYDDQTLKGKDRYYRSEDIYIATSNWWNHTISVSEKGSKNKSNANSIEDISTIPNMPGR